MKFRVSLVLLTLALSSAITAYASDCSNVTIRGTYAFTVYGQILPPVLPSPLLIDGIAKTTFDGNGNLTQVDAVAVNGNIPLVWRPGTGTYTVNPDCTGIMTLVNQDQAPLHLAILGSHSGGLIHTVVTDPGFAITSDAACVRAPRCSD
jgi:hypothetical protein